MQKEPLILLTGIGLVGYIILHDHPVEKGCWLCNYRGLIFMGSSVGLGVWMALWEED